MAESKQKPRRQAAQPARGLVHPDPQLSQAMQLLQAAGDLVIARLGSRSQRRRRWANEHPAEFYHELLRGLLRLAYCAAAARIEPGACAFESCGSGLRLGSAFQPHEHGEPAQAILDLAGQHSSNPGEGLAAVYQSLLALRPGSAPAASDSPRPGQTAAGSAGPGSRLARSWRVCSI